MKNIFAVFLLFFSSLVLATPLNRVVVFGDSLSDNGNLYAFMKNKMPLSPPYFEGRFTNGPVWVELLTSYFYPQDGNDHLLNYAFGGAEISEKGDSGAFFTFDREIDAYLLAHNNVLEKEYWRTSLFIVWIGANNYLAIPDNAQAAVNEVMKGLIRGLKTLVKKGATHILVVNMPDLGKIPIAREFKAVKILSMLSRRHNKLLALRMAQLARSYPHVQWISFDVNEMMHDILTHPADHGFSNIRDTCYEEMVEEPSSQSILKMVATVKPHLNNPDACNGYLFFDPVHPSAPAHAEMAEKTFMLLIREGIEFG